MDGWVGRWRDQRNLTRPDLTLCVQEVFLQFDKDKSGSVDTFELSNMFSKLGQCCITVMFSKLGQCCITVMFNKLGQCCIYSLIDNIQQTGSVLYLQSY